jgi:hypothetical protein
MFNFFNGLPYIYIERTFKSLLMEEFVVFNETFAHVTCHRSQKLIKVVWSGTFSKEQYQHTIEAALEYQSKETATIENYLSNILNQGIVNPESRKWFEQVAMPRAIKQGLKRAAVVFDGNVFKKYYLNLILQASSAYKLPLKFFNTEEDAIKWFDSFNNK